MSWLYFKHLLIRTWLEGPANRLRYFAGTRNRRRHPELDELNMESKRVDIVMKQIIQPSSNCIDIGCHIGSSLSSILRYAPQGKHMAFEPVPWKADWLKKKFPEVDVKAMALGVSNKECVFYINASRPGFSGFSRNTENEDRIEEVVVPCTRLDDVLLLDRCFSYIKIDVEGAELFVLQGGRQLIERDSPIILFESSHDGSNGLGYHRDELFNFFVDQLGYQVFKVKDFLEKGSPLDLEGFQQAAIWPFQAFNFLAVPRKSTSKSH